MTPHTLCVGLVQQTATADYQQTLATTLQGIRDAAAQGAQLIVLQELHTSLYFCQTQDPQYFDLAEPIPGRTADTLSQLAKTLGIVIVGSLFERRAPGIYHNTAVVFESNGELAGCYRKMHIPDDPGFNEKFYFTPGDLGFTPIRTSVGTLGVLVCWDQWFPEAARLMALAGADLLIYPTAIGWDPHDDPAEKTRQRDAWQIIQRAHAIANGIPLIVCNRVGFEPHPHDPARGTQFWGSSFITGCQGELLAEAPIDQPTTLTTALDLTRSEQVRRIWPYLRDRRIDAYNDLTRRFL